MELLLITIFKKKESCFSLMSYFSVSGMHIKISEGIFIPSFIISITLINDFPPSVGITTEIGIVVILIMFFYLNTFNYLMNFFYIKGFKKINTIIF